MSSNGSTVLVNGIESSSISVNDRGLSYGDGLFETLRVRNNKIPLWDYHRARLISGCRRLGIHLDLQALNTEIQQLLDSVGTTGRPVSADQLIKIVITRGPGKRGYSSVGANTPTRILFHSEYTVPAQTNFYSGVAVRICSTRLATNPQLAGIKHLNRLEQVLARSEWSDNLYAEGLMCDFDGNVVDGTMSNFLLVRDGQLFAADMKDAGVEGVMRSFLFDHAERLKLARQIKAVTLTELFDADELLICNSVFGVWPVRLLVDDSPDHQRRQEWSNGYPIATSLQSMVRTELFPQ